MEIETSRVGDVRIVTLDGTLDTNSTRRVQSTVLPLVQDEGRMALDVTAVDYMSSAGLRFLLSLFRSTTAHNGRLVLVGVGAEARDMMEVTGFLDFFTLMPTLDEALEALGEEDGDV